MTTYSCIQNREGYIKGKSISASEYRGLPDSLKPYFIKTDVYVTLKEREKQK